MAFEPYPAGRRPNDFDGRLMAGSFVIYCRRCPAAKVFDTPNWHIARAEAAAAGWRVRIPAGCICPACIKREAIAKKESANDA